MFESTRKHENQLSNRTLMMILSHRATGKVRITRLSPSCDLQTREIFSNRPGLPHLKSLRFPVTLASSGSSSSFILRARFTEKKCILERIGKCNPDLVWHIDKETNKPTISEHGDEANDEFDDDAKREFKPRILFCVLLSNLTAHIDSFN